MTSYKNVVKYKYEKNPADIVSLREYILFDDGKDGGRYAILKFVNNLDQSLYAVEFEAQQYDENGCLIAKTLALHDGFDASAGETFVPKAKLKLSANCASISVKLVSAQFDRVRWEKGNFSGNNYRFKRYVADKKAAGDNTDVQKPSPEQAKSETPENKGKSKKKAKKTQEKAFSARNIFRENHAAFPQVFVVLVTVLVLAFALATGIVVRRTSDEFSIGDYDVVKVSDTEVRIVGYDGKKNAKIPDKLGDYRVTSVGSDAFAGSSITSLFIEAQSLTISGNAFARCKHLASIRSSGTGQVRVLSDAFAYCTALITSYMPDASVTTHSFRGCEKVGSYLFGDTNGYTFEDIFG